MIKNIYRFCEGCKRTLPASIVKHGYCQDCSKTIKSKDDANCIMDFFTGLKNK